MTYASGDWHRKALSLYLISKYFPKHIDFQGDFVKKCVFFKASRPNKADHLGVTVLTATKNTINGTRSKDYLHPKYAIRS